MSRGIEGKVIFVSIFILFAGVSSSLPSIPSDIKRGCGLTWVETKELIERSGEKEEITKQIKSYLENQMGFLLRYQRTFPSLTVDQWRLLGKVENMERSTREIVRLNLGAESSNNGLAENKGAKEVSLVEKMIASIPKSDFGPEIQRAKVALAAFFWRKGNQKKTKHLLLEAQLLHPQGIVSTPMSTDHPFEEEFEAIVAGEKSVSKRKSCSLNLGLKEDVEAAWINGFMTTPRLENIQEGIYHFVVRNNQGYFSEKVLRCVGKTIEDSQWTWSEQIPGFRFDRYFSEYFSGSEQVIVLESKQRKIRGFLFSKKKGAFSLGEGALRWGSSFRLENARVLSLWKNALLDKAQNYTLPTAPSQRLTEEKWYNKKWIWTLVGGAIAGSVLLQELQGSERSPLKEGQILFQSD